MFRLRVLIVAVFVLSILEFQPIVGKRSFGSHSYPKSGGGLSGGGQHSYPRSGGLSGGGSHGYPSSGGLSGGGGSHGYPSSGGLSGGGRPPAHTYPSSSNNNGYPSSSNNRGYPSSSNNHGYPSSSGISGSNNKYPSRNTYTSHTTTNVHHHYHYSPPQQIRYTPVGGGVATNYPVYRGAPPTYVYQYKDSGSKYGTLLAGLALLNLGTLGTVAYMSSHGSHGSSSTYKAQPGEVCKFAIKKDNGDYEETRIDCQLISSFIYAEQTKQQNPTNSNTSNTITTTTVTNVTVVNNTGVPESAPMPGNIIYTMLPNGTLIPLNATNANQTVNSPAQPSQNNTVTSSVTVTTTTTNTTVADALSVKGKPVDVTPGMQCFVIRQSPMGNMRKNIPCGLLQSYADQSLKRNSAARNVPALTILAVVFTAVLVY